MPDKNITWKQQQSIDVRSVDNEPLTEKFKYMFQKILDKSQGMWLGSLGEDGISTTKCYHGFALSCE